MKPKTGLSLAAVTALTTCLGAAAESADTIDLAPNRVRAIGGKRLGNGLNMVYVSAENNVGAGPAAAKTFTVRK